TGSRAATAPTTAPRPMAAADPSRPSTRDQLARAILGLGESGTALTSGEVARGAAVDETVPRRLWRALRRAAPRGDAAYSAAHALGLITAAVGDELIDLDTAVQLTRALGQTMGKLADWQVATLSTRVEELGRRQRGPEQLVEGALDLVERVGPTFEELLVYAW